MKKLMMIATILVAGLMFMPNVLASYTEGYGPVTDATKPDSRLSIGNADIEQGETEDITYVKYSSTSFQLLDGDEGSGRPGNTAWVGITVSYPEGVTKDEGYKVYVNGQEYNGGEKNSNNYTEYFGITENNIKKALSKENHLLEYKVEFNWDSDDDVDQTVIIQIDPMSVELYKDHDMRDPVWTTQTAQEEMAKIEASKTPIEPSEQEPAEEAKKDETNPDTSDINLYMLFGLIAASGCGIAYTVKKRFY